MGDKLRIDQVSVDDVPFYYGEIHPLVEALFALPAGKAVRVQVESRAEAQELRRRFLGTSAVYLRHRLGQQWGLRTRVSRVKGKWYLFAWRIHEEPEGSDGQAKDR